MTFEAPGLRARLATSLTVLSTLAALLVSLAFWAGEEYLERDSINRLLSAEQRDSAASPAQRNLIAYTENLATRRGYWLLLLLVTGTTTVGGIAWYVSGRIARRSLAPLGELVEQIRALDPEQRQRRVQLASSDPELQVIVAALNAHMGQIDALVERERAFAGAASHELRTPLTVIGGAAAVLAQAQQVPAPVLARIERAVAHARQDLEALLALSRGRDAAPRSRVKLHELLPQVAAVHLDAAPDTGTRVHWDMPPSVEHEIAAGPLSIVFGNVLRNALTAARGGEIRIKVASDGVQVSDDGPGLPAELLRGDALSAPAARRDGSSGMGLYIAQTLARREGWTLTLKSAPAGGACVELRF